MFVLGLLQIATIYSATFQQFLAVRSLFGLFVSIGPLSFQGYFAVSDIRTDIMLIR